MKSVKVLSVVLILVLAAAFSTGCGRTPSRFLGKDSRQILTVEGMAEYINTSFDWRQDSTVKDVTFKALDGYVYTREFKDAHMFQGVIRWVPFNETDSIVQSRALSRWVGGVVNLRLPEDCAQVLGVDVSYSGSNERVKNLAYRSNTGQIFVREYREGLINRRFEGWLEIVAK
ncbi:MAG: hypothetical protein WC310_03290 [Patescibacteria group bacterium]|jgi:hypothetical protein